MKYAPVLMIAALVSGCAYPVSGVEQGSGPSSIYVTTAPADAMLTVDGVSAGYAAAFNGKKKAVFLLQPGRHHVLVSGPSSVLFDKEIYVGAGAKVAVEITK